MSRKNKIYPDDQNNNQGKERANNLANHEVSKLTMFNRSKLKFSVNAKTTRLGCCQADRPNCQRYQFSDKNETEVLRRGLELRGFRPEDEEQVKEQSEHVAPHESV